MIGYSIRGLEKEGGLVGVFNADSTHSESLAKLIAKFRVEMDSYKGIHKDEDINSAENEFNEYLEADYPIYGYEENGYCLGYLVCRVDKAVVWVESLFTLKEHRQKGIASLLFNEAEKLSASYDEETLYLYVHPNNDGMIEFCRRKGYDVLNLIEIRKKLPGEQINEQIKIRNNVFNY